MSVECCAVGVLRARVAVSVECCAVGVLRARVAVSVECCAVGMLRARVAAARKDTCSREVLRHDSIKDCVKLTRVRDHFICKSHRCHCRKINNIELTYKYSYGYYIKCIYNYIYVYNYIYILYV